MDVNPYGQTMSTVVPGSFVPDIGAQSAPKSELLPDDQSSATGSFKEALQGFIGDVNDKMSTAEQQSTDFATGKTGDFDGVVKSVEEASLAMQFTMAIRNKLMDAYTEVERMNF
jgi:flagellar hook-basal body complex protein FliE